MPTARPTGQPLLQACVLSFALLAPLASTRYVCLVIVVFFLAAGAIALAFLVPGQFRNLPKETDQSHEQRRKGLRVRLKDLNTKGYYLLVALAFLYSYYGRGSQPARSLNWAVTLTAVVAVLPVQDYVERLRILEIIRVLKVICLGLALLWTLWWVWCVRPFAT